jgi:c-di-GMP-binding flagellar brake protein YcgR
MPAPLRLNKLTLLDSVKEFSHIPDYAKPHLIRVSTIRKPFATLLRRVKIMTMETERRAQKRIQFESPVQISLLNERDVIISSLKSEGVLHDLSAGGCAFYHRQRLAVDDHVQVKIVLNDELTKKYNQNELTARGRIVRISNEADGRYLTAMCFMIDR